MKKALALVAFAALIGIPALGDSITGTAGWVYLRGDSDIYSQNELETTFETSDLDDFGGSVRYDKFLGEYVNLSGGFSFYQSDSTVEDVDFVFDNGQPVLRNIAIEVFPVEVSLPHVLPAGRNVPVIPYFGGGFGFYYWNYERSGTSSSTVSAIRRR